jgi:hypothetical protein
MPERLTTRSLNRALLARQGLLERLTLPAVEAVEAIGALQAQHWPAIPVALWTRVEGFRAAELHEALAARRLLLGRLLRGTQHVVSACQHPWYAAVVAASEAAAWRRTDGPAPPEMETLRAEVQAYAADRPRTAEELTAFVEAGVERLRPALSEAELAHQRSYRWRPFLAACALVRAPADGRWDGARLPAESVAPPAPAHPSSDGWIGWRTPPVREALRRLEPELVRFEDEAGRPLYDLPDGPRPDPGAPAPIRLLPWFDSVLLAYTPKHRARILPDAYRDRVYVRANLQWLPTFLVDGLVAGTWSVRSGRRHAALSLQPFAPLAKPARAALVEEAERLIRFIRPEAAEHDVAVEAVV